MKHKISKQRPVLEKVVELVRNPSESIQINTKLFRDKPIWLLGAGKASISMAKELLKDDRVRIKDGILLCNTTEKLENVQVFEAGHPLPNNDSVSASYELMHLAKRIPEGEQVVVCISGGASAMLLIPPEDLELEEIRKTYHLLLTCGATIEEVNTVRKHLCDIKGGWLAKALAHTKLHTLILSDVPSDQLEMVGSGPTLTDATTFKDAFQVLKRYEIWNKVPHEIRIRIAAGMHGQIEETPKTDWKHPNHTVIPVNTAQQFSHLVAQTLKEPSVSTWVSEQAYSGDIRKVAKRICGKAIEVLNGQSELKKPAILVFYGESTVDVKGSGKGGRNQELALMCALSLEGQHSVSMLSIGTDGKDGNTDAAGALITSYTMLEARKMKLDPEALLMNNDSYRFHESMESLVKIGHTGTNLMDLQVLMIE